MQIAPDFQRKMPLNQNMPFQAKKIILSEDGA